MYQLFRLLSLICMVIWATPAFAQPAKDQLTTARESFRAGQKKLEAGQYEGALADFVIADAVVRKPSTRLAVAQALTRLRRFVEARDKARSIASMPTPAKEHPTLVKAREDAAALVKELDKRVARVTFTLSPADAVLTLDGESVSAAQRAVVDVDPGEHEVRASGPGFTPFEQTFKVKEGEKHTLGITLAALPAPPTVLAPPPRVVAMPCPPPTPPLSEKSNGSSGPLFGPVAWTGVGIAGAGLITGAVAGGIATSRAAEIKEICTAGDGNDCLPPEHDEHRNALVSAYVSTGGFILAGVGVGVSLVGLFAADKPAEGEVAVMPILSPGMLGVSGTF